MKSEFRRDISHNYLILQEEEKVDTSAYQVRMLLGNLIPSVLKCHLQSLDGQEYFCYDITSRQSLFILFEERKFQIRELRMIFDGFVRVMEELTEFLMNPDQLVLQPEYIYLDISRGRVYFCCLPGFHREIQEQLRELTEYILPKLEHKDQEAVALGYGVYRKLLEPGFQLETLKEAVYRTEENEEEPVPADREEIEELHLHEEQESFQEQEKIKDQGLQSKETELSCQQKQKKSIWIRRLIWGCLGALAVMGISAAGILSLIPWISAELVLAAGIMILAAGALISWIHEKSKRKKEETAVWKARIRKTPDGKKEDRDQIEMQWEDDGEAEDGEWKKENRCETTGSLGEALEKEKEEELYEETVLLFSGQKSGPAAFVSREPGELATIFLDKDLTVIGKLANASDAVIPIPTVSRIHARVRQREGEYYLADLNSRNGTAVNGTMLKGGEEYLLQDEDQVDFAQARYVFVTSV